MATNLEKLQTAFFKGLNLSSIDQIPALKLKESPNWDSVGHITLISEIEDAFDLDLEADDMFEIDTCDSAIKVLESKYNQRF